MSETRTTVVVGASGYLGRTVVERLRETDRTVVGTHCSNPKPWTDVDFDFWTDDLADILGDIGADEVVFAASVEYGGDLDTGDSGNEVSFVAAADRFANACAGRRLIYVSSGAVFEGERGGYVESDRPTPRDRYGNRLLAMEKLIAQQCSDAVCFRMGYLFGYSRGDLDRHLSRTREHVTDGRAIAYFTDMFKSPLHVDEATAAVRELLTADATGIVHAPAPRTSVYDFHQDAMTALGYDASLVDRDSIPDGLDVAPDRSLHSERFGDLVGFEPSTVTEALATE
jgi:dTDP-4-dehydrorhamnose reductase